MAKCHLYGISSRLLPTNDTTIHIIKTQQSIKVGIGFHSQGNDFTKFLQLRLNTQHKGEERNGSNIDLCSSCQNK